MIPRTKEFFISLKDHDDWGVAHTVWGEVALKSSTWTGPRLVPIVSVNDLMDV